MSPLILLAWAGAVIATALAVFVVAIVIALIVTMFRRPKRPTDRNIIGGGR